MNSTQELLEKLSDLYKASNYNEILSLLNETPRSEYGHPYFYFYLVKAQQASQHDNENVLQACNEGLALFSDYNPLRVVKFEICMAVGDTQAAIDEGMELYNASYIDINLYLDLSKLLNETGRLVESKMVSRDAYYHLLVNYYFRGDYNKALKCVEVLKNAHTEFQPAKLYEVKTYLQQGRFETALELAGEYQHCTEIRYDLLRLLTDFHKHHGNDDEYTFYSRSLFDSFPQDAHAKKQVYSIESGSRTIHENMDELTLLLEDEALDFSLHIKKAELTQALVHDSEYLNVTANDQKQWSLISALYDTGVKDYAKKLVGQALQTDKQYKGLIAFCKKLSASSDYEYLGELLKPLALLEIDQPLLCAFNVKALGWRNVEDAQDFAAKALLVHPDDPDITWAITDKMCRKLVYGYSCTKSLESIQKWVPGVEMELKRSPDNAYAHFYQGYIHCAQEAYDLAAVSLRKARDIGMSGNGLPYSAYWLSYAEYKLGNYESALDIFDNLFIARSRAENVLPSHHRLREDIQSEMPFSPEKEQFNSNDTVSVFKVLKEAFNLSIKYVDQLTKILMPLLVVSLVSIGLDFYFRAESAVLRESVSFFFGLAYYAVLIITVIACHRLFILGGEKNFISLWSGNEFKYLGWCLLIGLCLYFYCIVAFLFLALLQINETLTLLDQTVFYVLLITVIYPVLYLAARWSLVLPSTALGMKGQSLKWSWSTTSGSGLKLSLLLVLLPLYMILAAVINTGYESPVFRVLYELTLIFVVIFEVCLLSIIYKFLVMDEK